jgi:DNA-binding NtrC family response regulator
MQMPGLRGDEVLRRFRRIDPDLPIIVVTAHGTISGAVSAIRDGAFEYITKPFRNEHLVNTVQKAVARRSVARPTSVTGLSAAITAIIGQGLAIQSLISQIEAVVSTDYSIVIRGAPTLARRNGSCGPPRTSIATKSWSNWRGTSGRTGRRCQRARDI